MNAPESGTVKEFLANEEDTVTVGQDLLTLELGGVPDSGNKQHGGSEPKSPASDDQSTSSDPEPQKDKGPSMQESKPPPSPDTKPKPSKEENKAKSPSEDAPSKDESSLEPQGPKSSGSSAKEVAPSANRDERRVSFS